MERTKKMVMTALFSAVLCLVSPVVIPLPISPVPVSLAPCMIFISAFVLKPLQCTVSVLIYILIGMTGMPVFAGFTGGVGIIAGPTGGYIAGYLAAAFTASSFNNRLKKKYMYVIGMISGLLLMYSVGTLWFSVSQNVSMVSALSVCVIPYLIGDVIKIAAALFIGTKLRNYRELK